MGRMVIISIKVDDELLKSIDLACKSLRINRSEFFRAAARYMLLTLGVNHGNIKIKHVKVS